ncbi:MAG: membrane protein insertase YidC [Bacteroidota bacterium]
MDKNTIIGLGLIALIVIGFGIYMRPNQEQMDAYQRQQDSLFKVEVAKHKTDSLNRLKAVVATETPKKADTLPSNDSLKTEMVKQQFGAFAEVSSGKNEFVTLENDLVKLTIATKGGRIYSAELKKYKTYDSLPLRLFDGDSTVFGLELPTNENKVVNTNDLYFKPSSKEEHVGKSEAKSISMRLNAGNNHYIEYQYSLSPDSYMLNFNLNAVGMDKVIPQNINHFDIDWKMNIPRLEKNLTAEKASSTIYYKYMGDELDWLSESKDDSKVLPTRVNWVSFKQQYFTTVFIANEGFDKANVTTKTEGIGANTVKNMSSIFTLPFNHSDNQTYAMRFYFGPNHYQTLKKANLMLEKQIPLGWGIFGWVNKFLVIPIFNFLNGFNINYGIIILLMTIFIKVILLPLTFKSFQSQAKMKVLKPEVEEINEKFKDDAMSKQSEMMKLYKKAGVNPMGGCFPMLLQMPILIAMFRFFPASIELRQQSFLWAKDLSTYDSIYDFGFNVPFYGDHISLFTLLMTVSTLLYTRMTMQMQAQNPQMKWMSYLMPIMFLGIFNNYSAGLSYYYFLANMFTFGQQYLFKFFIDEKKIHAQIQENKKKPAKPKSSWQQRLEEAAKQRGYQAPKKK